MSRFWFIKFPSNTYAQGPIDFGKPVDEQEVEYARRVLAALEVK